MFSTNQFTVMLPKGFTLFSTAFISIGRRSGDGDFCMVISPVELPVWMLSPWRLVSTTSVMLISRASPGCASVGIIMGIFTKMPLLPPIGLFCILTITMV